ncbi:MAG: beta-N-acetylhexosaminidase [Peptostreptococcaceae bacterium]|nr:beta-N-acetylhexosaminidase [Peptostreptococcaceae bacterium]
MKKITLCILLIITTLLTLSLSRCSDKNNQTIDVIQQKLDNMTLDEKIGQMITIGIDGYSVDDTAKQLITDKKVGGVILFKNNINDSNQLLQLINDIKGINSTNKIPIFISVDQEGGRVNRLPSEIKSLPSNEIIGNKNDNKLAYDIGKNIGYALGSFGFNMDFAPVLDVNSNPNNTVIGDRSFSNDKDKVASLGASEINGFKDSNIISAAKHFPGHGDTATDSHYALPIINKTLDELKSVEFVPFKKAIEEKVPAIMVSHILMPQIDANNPASMSKTIITDILRKDLKFDGLIVTDDMTMGAVTNELDITTACINSINAGADLLLVCHGYDNEINVINAIKDAVNNGIISIDTINSSVYKILSLKENYKITDEKIEKVDINTINTKFEDILIRINN